MTTPDAEPGYRRARSGTTCTFGSPPAGALRRCKCSRCQGASLCFAPCIASRNWRPNAQLVPERARSIAGPDWQNRICASLALALAFYRPVAMAGRVRCPALVIAVDDSVAPAAAAVRTAQRIGSPCELHRLPIGHFDLYTGEGFERGLALQLSFLRRVLVRAGSAVP